MLDEARITEQRAALCDAAGQAFYNTSKFTLRDLKSRGSQQQLLADFEDYLNGFSPNVQDILENFKFRNQLHTLSKADAIGTLINKFLDPDIDLSPAGIDNHSMGTVFEELVRKFNEENNEEAGEHWTPRDAVRLMANLVFLPIEAEIKSGTYLLYDCACGTGGMLTVAEETLTAIGAKRGQQVKCLLYGQEINPETYAVCKADMLLKGEGESADHIVGGAEWSTLSHDAFPAQEFDFMLANPPYGKSWKKDLEAMGGKDGMRDPRFKVMHKGEELSLVTRSSDGQMLFLANMASKMNAKSALGSRIAEVHNGSSLFTGDAGQGESNIRRWLIENDWLEAIVALPLNLFYNTGIATYIWVLSNRKPAHRKGQVQLIDASQWFKPLRKNLGKKNCELSPEDIERISRTFLDFKETPESKIFPNAAFGYWKVTVERPLRLHSQLTLKAIETLRFTSGDEDMRAALYEEFGDDLFTKFAKVSAALEKRLADWGNDEDEGDDEEGGSAKKGLPEKKRKKLLDPKTWERDGRLVEVATKLRAALGDTLFEDHNVFRDRVDAALKKADIKLAAADLKQILKAVSWRVETAPPVIAKVHKPGKAKADPLRGLFEATVDGKPADRRVRARLRPARHRAGAAAGRRRHRGLHPPRGAALHARRVDQGRRHQDRLRGQLHAALLQAAAAAHARRDQRRHPRHREGSRGAAGRLAEGRDACVKNANKPPVRSPGRSSRALSSAKAPAPIDEATLLRDLRTLVQSARQRIATVANATYTMLCWQVGRRLLRENLQSGRAAYGKQILATVSQELTAEFGAGFDYTALTRMARLAEWMTDERILATLSQTLSWSHFVQLLPIKDPLARDFYAEMCRIERWDVRTLRLKIGGMLYQRTALSKKPQAVIAAEIGKLRDGQMSPDTVFRDPYLLDLLGLKGAYSERDLESAILREIEGVLLELGTGFAFVARQKRMSVGKDDFHLDLLFFHRHLRRLIAVELKLESFQPAHVGQMELYLRWLDKHERAPGEEAPIGLILCASADAEQVELLELDAKSIRVSEYLTELPPLPLLRERLHQAIEHAKEQAARRLPGPEGRP